MKIKVLTLMKGDHCFLKPWALSRSSHTSASIWKHTLSRNWSGFITCDQTVTPTEWEGRKEPRSEIIKS